MSSRPGGWRCSRAGSSLERTVSLRSGAQVQDALEVLGHEVIGDRRGHGPRRAAARARARRRLHRAARARRRGWHRPIAARSARPALHGIGPGRVHARHRQGARQAPDARGGHPDAADFYALREPSIKELGAGAALPSIEQHARLPARREAVARRLGAGRQVRSLERGAARRDGRRVLLRPHDSDRALRSRARPRGVGARREGETGAGREGGAPRAAGRSRCRSSRRYPAKRSFYDYESRYEIGMTTFVCPAELPAETTAAGAGAGAVEVYGLLGCHGVARVDLMLDERDGRAVGAGDERRAGHDRDEPAAAGGRRRGHRLRGAGRRGCWRARSRASGRRQAPVTSRLRRSPRGRPGPGTP